MVAKHLREGHNLENHKERAILNHLATGRTPVPPGPCPLPLCAPYLLNLEKHLKGHKECTAARPKLEIRALKRSAAIALLAELRATNPDPPMVSALDLADELEDPEEGTSLCQNRACVHARQRVREFDREVLQHRKITGDLNKQLQGQPGPQPPPLQVESSDDDQQPAPQQWQQQEPDGSSSSGSLTSSSSSSEEENHQQEPQSEVHLIVSLDEEQPPQQQQPEQQQQPPPPSQQQQPEQQQQQPEQTEQPQQTRGSAAAKRKLPFSMASPSEVRR
ncbi:adenylate cyclase, terminal-differentiation specific-like [Epinephelus moara]|uniref:adenylate cyclase, terminal-differentiation specific-like n=1 Tax=Epinephelus moara TaxID=300413 RepID=UPI00214DF39B|nr:adenylate cyclase, terminal-differentiation specific-like [Epinephelus moara]